MRALPSVDWSDAHPFLWCYLAWADELHWELTGEQLTITSMRRSGDARRGGHNPGPGLPVRAVDVRRWALDGVRKARVFVDSLNAAWAPHVLVLLEPEDIPRSDWPRLGITRPPQPHVHIQLETYKWPSAR